MATIFVTGATGFVGSEITRQLVEQGAEVRILRRESSSLDLLGDIAGRVEHAVGDVTDPRSILGAMRGIRRVYHTAGYVGYRGRRDRSQLQRVNVEGTANVINAALEAGVDRLVHTSSMAAFSRPERQETVLDETAEWHRSPFNTEYALSKYLGELEVHRGIAEGLDAVIVNPALVFGPGREGENTRRIAEKVRDRTMPAVPEGGTNVVDVRDVAAGHLLAMERGQTGERYFLGSENLAWREIMKTFADISGVSPPRLTVGRRAAIAIAAVAEAAAFLARRPPLITFETARVSSTFFRYDNSKAVRELGCSFRPFAETARWMADVLGES